MTAITFTNAMILDGTGAEAFPGRVAVADGRIQDVARTAGENHSEDGSTTLDCGGRTVMPGLVESHAHISFNNMTGLEEMVHMQVEDHTLLALDHAQLLLDAGFTSLFSAAAAKPRLDVAVRDAINSGRFIGPRIRAASQEISPSGNLGDLDSSYLTLPRAVRFNIACDGPDAFRQAVRLAARDGVDNVKINVSGDRDWGHMHADDRVTVIEEAELAAAVTVARARDLMVCAHCTSSEGVKMCVRQGVDVIYHAVHADEGARDLLEEAKDRVFVAPAVGLPYSMLHRQADFGLHWDSVKLESLARELEITSDCMADLHRRGVRVLPGGDYGAFVTNPIGSNARDLGLFVELFGFTPGQAIVAATKWGGELMQHPGEVGVIAPGTLADLLVIDGDPLTDIALLTDRARISAIMIGGRFRKCDLSDPAAAAI